MVEIHGWVTIRETYKVIDDDNTDYVVSLLDNEFKKNKYISPKIEYMNGEPFIQISLYTNHWSSDCEEIINMYKVIANKAEGSYGLLYIQNNEDKELYNEFVVYRLARGKVEKCKDTFLSPYVPVVEDEDDLL